ncbi:TPA: DNA repair protein RadC [Yersinia enterocolitica]|uniref:RadC family protein n=1 Tax=Yersinia enterocolitica TaxID=630 RepID=UPI0033035EC3|nr:DNA repair protein RadC [Yersinia ruckeri]HDL6874685.1 DNA repair protein RadC [Yersinia enterocolitica]HDL6891120.1 DNA repair protein RadC [Yersinia enterocolitica]
METITLSPTAAEIPPTTQRAIKRALTLLETHLREPGTSFTSLGTVSDWLRLRMARLEREVFMVLWLDNQHRLLAHETLFTGSINSTEVHPREIVKAALQHNAAAVLLAHCHPSGHAEPSVADQQITGKIKDALALVEVRMLDHCIVGGMTVYSFAEHGLL